MEPDKRASTERPDEVDCFNNQTFLHAQKWILFVTEIKNRDTRYDRSYFHPYHIYYGLAISLTEVFFDVKI